MAVKRVPAVAVCLFSTWRIQMQHLLPLRGGSHFKRFLSQQHAVDIRHAISVVSRTLSAAMQLMPVWACTCARKRHSPSRGSCRITGHVCFLVHRRVRPDVSARARVFVNNPESHLRGFLSKKPLLHLQIPRFQHVWLSLRIRIVLFAASRHAGFAMACLYAAAVTGCDPRETLAPTYCSG